MNEVAVSNDTALMSFIERASKDPDFDVQKFGELLRLQRDVGHDLSRRSFNRAMAAAQSEMMPVIRSAQNKHLGNRYAKLEDVDREMRPIYTKHGFSVRFGSAPAPREGDIRITCTVAHEDGYAEENYLDAPSSLVGSQGGRMAITPVQAVGSVVTYLRRYLETMVFNVVLADDDDDGEGQRRPGVQTPSFTAPASGPPVSPPSGTPPKSTLRVPRTGAEWSTWVDRLQLTLATLKGRAEYHAITDAPAFQATIEAAPPQVRRDIDAILTDTYENLPATPIENDPTIGGEELPEVEIVGADKIAAG